MRGDKKDFPDFRSTLFHEHGDERPANRSANRNFYDVLEARLARRSFMAGGLAGFVAGMFGAGLSLRAALAQDSAPSAFSASHPSRSRAMTLSSSLLATASRSSPHG